MKINITISETIRVAPYEVIKPAISCEYEVPQGVTDVAVFYQAKYREVKRLWNMHLYNMLYSTSTRGGHDNIFDFAEELLLGKEKFPTFKLRKQKKQKEKVQNGEPV